MKTIQILFAAATLLLAVPAVRAQDDGFPDMADHGVALQHVIREWHDVGLYTAGWDSKPGIRNYFVGLAHAFPGDLFQMIENKMLGLDVDDAVWNYELDEKNGYIAGELGTETSPSVQMCYWRCSDGSRLIGVALQGYEYNLEEPDPNWTEEEAEDKIHVCLNDIAFFRILQDEQIWRPVPVRKVCGRDIDFKAFDQIQLPRQGKDIVLTDHINDKVVTLKWNGNGFTAAP